MAAILLGAFLLTGGCALDPNAVGPDMGTEIPAGGAPASGLAIAKGCGRSDAKLCLGAQTLDCGA
jgi:hypothetical protein